MKLYLSVALAALLITSLAGAAKAADTVKFFPPEGCTPSTPYITWNGDGTPAKCVAVTPPKPNCRVCIQFVDDAGQSQAGSWECTPYGGGISNFAFDANKYDPDGARVSFDCK